MKSKSNKIILAVLILSIVALFFSGCSGSGGVPTVPPTPESEDFLSDDFALIQVKYPESNILFIAGKENKNTMLILGEKNNQGDPTKITKSVYVSEQGDELYFKKGVDGLPIYAVDCEGYIITFENYTSSTVDIALYDSNENLIEGPATIEIDPTDFLTIEDLLATKQSNNSYHSQPKLVSAVIPPWVYWHFTDYLDFGFIDDFTISLLEYTIGKEKTVLITKMGTGEYTITYPETEVPSYSCSPPVNLPGFPPVWDIIADIYEDEESTQNHPPVISSLNPNPSSIDISQTTTITCSASDQDGDSLTYHWTKNGGAFIGSTSGPSVTWRAPSTPGIYRVYCEVSDGKGGEDSDSANIIVTESNEEEIESICSKLISALNSKNWNKARSYCINGSEAYNQVYELENSVNNYESWYGPGNLNINTNINNIVINGNYATVYGYFSYIFTAGSYIEENSGSVTGYLEKIGSNWKIYKGVIPNL